MRGSNRRHQHPRKPANSSLRRREFIFLPAASAASWAFAVRAQQEPVPVIGYLSTGSPESDNIPSRLIAFRRSLNEMGYVEGQNVAIEYRGAEGQYDRLPSLAADLVQRQVVVIVAPGTASAVAAKAATATIPIVFNIAIDPVQSGLVASLSHPGGNITGVSLMEAELSGKRLDLLHELLPAATVVALLVNPSNPVTASETTNLKDAARMLGLQAHGVEARTPTELDAAFQTLADLRVGALVVSADTFFTSQRAQIVSLAARHAVPAIYVYRLFPAIGGLSSYGPDLADSYRQVGELTSKILRATKPADLPVQQAVKLELVINLETARALGLTIPPAILARADEVIE
jgi:putative tryptophan/tyrosine transport system substrate-binding protein